MATTIKSFKGFDKDMKCRGFQYEVGKTYTHEGGISVCNRGFHACENPFDVLNYYNDIEGKYCEVEQSGNTQQKEDKIASSEIRIVAEIGSSGNSAQIDSTGEDSVICCAGHNSAIKAKKGSWITLSEWQYNEEVKRHIPKCVKTEYVDGERIKADTWYKLINGEFTEI